MLVKTYSAVVNGLDVTTVTLEVSTTPGSQFHLTGLGDEAVREGRNRVIAAMENNGYEFPIMDITINMAPADIRKAGTGFDLPFALGLLQATGNMSVNLDGYMFVGELSLDGSLLPVKGILPISIQARKEQFKGLIVPKANAREAAVVNRLKVYGMDSMAQVVRFLKGEEQVEPTIVDTRREFYEQQSDYPLDYSDVRGQESVKRALEVAAAGGHNLIMVGPPGSGKSMMAKRLPSILPPLTLSESLETTQIHSVAGILKQGTSLITQRPFRAPHHTISEVALVGGGVNPMPGEISMAHNGVLFCDELPGKIQHHLPLQLHVRGQHEPLSVWLLWRPHAPLCVHADPAPTLSQQDFGSSARPHRHTVRDFSRTVQGLVQAGAGRAFVGHPRAGDEGPRPTDRAIQGCEGRALQRADDRAHDPPVCGAR